MHRLDSKIGPPDVLSITASEPKLQSVRQLTELDSLSSTTTPQLDGQQQNAYLKSLRASQCWY